MDILNNIISEKLKELAYLKKSVSISTLEKSSFFKAKTKSLSEKIKQKEIGIIAEHKRRSPSKSKINYQTPSKSIIKGYDNGGAAGISFLTEKNFFGGSSLEFTEARRITNLPMLRKDFIIDEYQIIESKSIGADAILLIAACLNSSQIKNLSKLAKSFDLEVLIEIHDLEELNKVCIDSIDIIGINNRNLKTLEISINNTISIFETLKSHQGPIISESGIKNEDDVKYIHDKTGIKNFLIGESLLSSDNPAALMNKIVKINQ